MRLVVEIECNTQAFRDGFLHSELCSVLEELAAEIGRGNTEGRCLDSDGKRVGDWSLVSAG